MRHRKTQIVYIDPNMMDAAYKGYLECIREKDFESLCEVLITIRSFTGKQFYAILAKFYCLMDLQPNIIESFVYLFKYERYLALTVDFAEEAANLLNHLIDYFRRDPIFCMKGHYSTLTTSRKIQRKMIEAHMLESFKIGRRPYLLPELRKILKDGVLELIAFMAEGWTLEEEKGWLKGKFEQAEHTDEQLKKFGNATKMAAYSAFQETVFDDEDRAKFRDCQWYKDGERLFQEVTPNLISFSE